MFFWRAGAGAGFKAPCVNWWKQCESLRNTRRGQPKCRMKLCRIHSHTHSHMSGSGLGGGTARQEPSRNRNGHFRRRKRTHRHTCIMISVFARDCSNPADSPRCCWILILHSEEIVQLDFLKSLPSGRASVTQIEGRGRMGKKTHEKSEVRMGKKRMLLWDIVGCNTSFMRFRLGL